MDENYERAKRRVNQLKGFYTNLIVYIVVIIFLAVVNYLTSPGIWWFLIVAFIWGIFVVGQGISVYRKRGLFSKEWEDKKIKEYMEKEDNE
ncbi:2TM domain-containing protein [Methanobacterium sp.]|uniref:2TM domain-containing protein n=2 Tax=Methanobacterium sp. TaxID=2164 RepID=UPI003C793DFD